MGVGHGGQFIGSTFGFQMAGELSNTLLQRACFEPLLLSPPPWIGRVGSATRGRLRQVLAHMVIIAEKNALAAKNLRALELDPSGPIPQRVDLAVQPPAGTP